MGLKGQELKAAVKDRAAALGFELAGVTTADPPPHLDVYQRWLDRGHHGEMEYMARERSRSARADPTMLLPGCRSIIVLGAKYNPPHKNRESSGRPGKVAAYAVGDDYHEVLIDRLQELMRFIEDNAGQPVAVRPYTDTGPILEREFAQRAGLGWIGKNTMLINPQAGSYFLLAELLLSIELPPDGALQTDHCGSCTRCLEACPTGCILPDRTIDASRCISYLTIELRGSIEVDLREQMGDWLFGCDVCQEVCPWNLRFATASDDPAFQPRRFLQQAGIEEFLRLDVDGYRKALSGSPLKRSKRGGLLRNAAVAAGNNALPGAVSELRGLLGEGDPTVRSHAAWALGRIATPDARKALHEAITSEVDPQVREEISRALASSQPSTEDPGT